MHYRLLATPAAALSASGAGRAAGPRRAAAAPHPDRNGVRPAAAAAVPGKGRAVGGKPSKQPPPAGHLLPVDAPDQGAHFRHEAAAAGSSRRGQRHAFVRAVQGGAVRRHGAELRANERLLHRLRAAHLRSGRAVAEGTAPVRAAVHSKEAAALLRACVLFAADRRKVVLLRRGAAAFQRCQVHESRFRHRGGGC